MMTSVAFRSPTYPTIPHMGVSVSYGRGASRYHASLSAKVGR